MSQKRLYYEYAYINKPTVPVFQLGKVLRSHEHIAIRLRTTLPCSIERHQTDLVEIERVCLVWKFNKDEVDELTQEGIESIGEKE